MSGWQKAAIFVSGSVIGSLALAFLGVIGLYVLRPELVAQWTTGGPDALAVRPDIADPAKTLTTGTASTPVVAAPPASREGAASYSSAVRIAAPTVVNLYVTRVASEPVLGGFLDDPFGEFAPFYRRRVEQSLGSGVILDPSGQIVTNHHVIDDAAVIRVQLADGRSAEAEIVGRDPDTDLAVLKIDLPDLPSIRLGRSDTLSVGDVVLAIGNPIGLSQTVTQGIVSATGRDQLGIATFENFIQTDAPINLGNSGGALINTRGELVGVNTAIIAKSLGVEGIGFAIPVNLVRGVVNEIVTRGKVLRGWIGISTETIDEARASSAGFDRPVVRVTRISVGSPAQRAGLLSGDIILGIDNKVPRSSREAQLRIAGTPPGQTISIEVQRRNQRGTISIRVEEAPQKVQSR
ncbi:MAG: PDZ domain-containing protein [Gammaproteobacteria bacterium]|nr:PDZ domain-containing protein [Gammaproteobacteria bacterium]